MDPAISSAGGELDNAAEWRTRAPGGTEYSWLRAVPGGTGTTLLALRLSRSDAAEAAQAALRSLRNAHPVLRARLRASPTGPTLAFPDRAPPPAPLLLPLAPLGAPDSARDFHALLEHELNRNPWADPASASADDAPVLFATLYELPPAAALFVRIHTVACDRSAANALARELVALLAGGEEGGDELDPEDAAAEAALEERIPQKDTWKPFWARGLDMVGYSINGLRTSTLPFVETGTERSTQMLRLGLGRDETTRLLDACKENGVRLCSAMTAATMLAARQSKPLESGQQETYSVVTLIDCREYLEPPLDDRNVGFFYSAITNTHTIHGEEGLWELAKRCHDSYTGAKNNKKHLTDISDLNFLMCRAIEAPQLTTAGALRTALVSVFEEPVVADMAEVQSKAGVEDCVCCATVHGIGPSIGVFDSIKDGKLEWACVYPSPLHSRKQVQEIFDKVKRILLHAEAEENFEECA